MIRHAPILLLVLALSLVGCSSGLIPVDPVKAAEAKLLGKWQAKGPKFNPIWSFTAYTDKQFEFLADGSVAESWLAVGGTVKSAKAPTGWQQIRTGAFKFADATHVKVDFGWEWGTTIYGVDWKDDDHVTLRAGDTEMISLHRVN